MLMIISYAVIEERPIVKIAACAFIAFYILPQFVSVIMNQLGDTRNKWKQKGNGEMGGWQETSSSLGLLRAR